MHLSPQGANCFSNKPQLEFLAEFLERDLFVMFATKPLFFQMKLEQEELERIKLQKMIMGEDIKDEKKKKDDDNVSIGSGASMVHLPS
jgi:hypothetical protein